MKVYKYYISHTSYYYPKRNMVSEVYFNDKKVIENLPEYGFEYCYGYVEYTKPLTISELEIYDLIPIEDLVECECCGHSEWLHRNDMIEAYGKIICKDCLDKVITEKLMMEFRFLEVGDIIIHNGIPARINDYQDYPDGSYSSACREYEIELYNGDIMIITDDEVEFVLDGLRGKNIAVRDLREY